ncbi:hypothetical protein GCM10027174_19950 [Salinifilum aidingensis]
MRVSSRCGGVCFRPGLHCPKRHEERNAWWGATVRGLDGMLRTAAAEVMSSPVRPRLGVVLG